jgi:hypothetical protein
MDIDRIEAKIASVLEYERETGVFSGTLRTLRKIVKEEQVEAITKGVTSYVQLVPLLLREAQAKAQRQGIAAFEEILAEAVRYWDLEEDASPDFLGLNGVLDDAYYSLSLLQGLSDHCKTQYGTPLLEQDLTEVNNKMRKLLATDTAAEVDSYVSEKLGVLTAGDAFAQVFQALVSRGPFMRPDSDPIWGSASTEEIARARLGAMGIV